MRTSHFCDLTNDLESEGSGGRRGEEERGAGEAEHYTIVTRIILMIFQAVFKMYTV